MIVIVVLAILAAYLGHRVIHGVRVYYRFRGTRLVTCPETHQAAMVEVAARSMGMQAILDEPCLRVIECSRWPMHRECGQDCLREWENANAFVISKGDLRIEALRRLLGL